MAAAIIETTLEMLQRLNQHRLKVNPRVIKAKMSKWPLKRAHHRDPARPEAPPTDTIVITGPSRPAPRKRQTTVRAGLDPNQVVLGLTGLTGLTAARPFSRLVSSRAPPAEVRAEQPIMPLTGLLARVTSRPSQGPSLATITPHTQRSGQERAHADASGESHPDTSGTEQSRQAGRQPDAWRAPHDLEKPLVDRQPGQQRHDARHGQGERRHL